jgi:hypothetical protein
MVRVTVVQKYLAIKASSCAEFLELAKKAKFHLGESLEEFLDRLTERFTLEMEPAALSAARQLGSRSSQA